MSREQESGEMGMVKYLESLIKISNNGIIAFI